MHAWTAQVTEKLPSHLANQKALVCKPGATSVPVSPATDEIEIPRHSQAALLCCSSNLVYNIDRLGDAHDFLEQPGFESPEPCLFFHLRNKECCGPSRDANSRWLFHNITQNNTAHICFDPEKRASPGQNGSAAIGWIATA